MDAKERFRQCLNFGSPDRIPYFEEGIRRRVFRQWKKQGMPSAEHLKNTYPTDLREEIVTDLDPIPAIKKWPRNEDELPSLKKRLDAADDRRLPKGWKRSVSQWRSGELILLLRVHRGFFLSLGVYDWKRFTESLFLVVEDRSFVQKYLTMYGEFAAQVAARILRDIKIDAAFFSEPIGGNEGPLISPRDYESLVLASYKPLLDVLRKNNVQNIILRTYANVRLLIPSMLKYGINCLWACETNAAAMDYVSLRREFGRDLRLIGGIDLDSLRRSKSEIKNEFEKKLPFLLKDGGYIPIADGRIREDIPYENYIFYRRLLQQYTAT